MQNLLRFILKYSNFLIFLCLEVVSFLMFFSFQPLPRSSALTASNAVVASVSSMARSISDYFSLASVNRQLAEENARLLTENSRLQSLTESSAERDSNYCYSHLEWQYTPAKVVDIETGTFHNYLVINKGSRDNIVTGNGVICNRGVVGVVSAVNSHFALVTPVIHPKMNVSCRLKEDGHIGFLHWQGGSFRYATMTDVARHVTVHQGDTVITSGLTSLFPESVNVGVIDKVVLNEGDTYYSLRVRLFTDFSDLRYVQVINNPLSALQDSIKAAAR